MIQRKQSIYLLLVTVLMSFLLIRPYAELALIDGQTLVFHSLLLEITSNPHESVNISNIQCRLFLLVLLTGSSEFCQHIFYYNRRILQIRLCIVSAVLLVLIMLIMFIIITRCKNTLEYIHACISGWQPFFR